MAMPLKKILTPVPDASSIISDRQSGNKNNPENGREQSQETEHEKDEKAMPELVRDRRGRRSSSYPDLYLEGLAREIGVTPGWLSKLFRGIGSPSSEILFKLSAALGKPMDEVHMMFQVEREKRQEKAARRKKKTSR